MSTIEEVSIKYALEILKTDTSEQINKAYSIGLQLNRLKNKDGDFLNEKSKEKIINGIENHINKSWGIDRDLFEKSTSSLRSMATQIIQSVNQGSKEKRK